MVKSYNKYELSETFGLVASGVSNVISVSEATKAAGPGLAVVGANESVLTWDVKKGELIGRWNDKNCNSQTTAIARSVSDSDIFAVG
jgi:U3 small nucleolar RNA-associated protein 12